MKRSISLAVVLLLVAASCCSAQSLAVSSGDAVFAPLASLPEDIASAITPQTPGYVEDSDVAFVDLVSYAQTVGAAVQRDAQAHTVKLVLGDRELVFFTVTPEQFFDAHYGMTVARVEAPPQPDDPARLLRTTCVRVIDGDTIEIASGEKVRYIGIDAPEMNAEDETRRHLAQVAKRVNRGMVEGRELVIELGVEERDRYGRLLGYIYSGNVFVNAALVAGGYAQAATYPPNVKHAELFVTLATQAWEANRGLWAAEPERAQEEQQRQRRRETAAPEPERERKPPPATGDVGVYITNTGDCYHRGSCSSLRKSKTLISLAEAKRRGYRPCKRCHPPQ